MRRSRRALVCLTVVGLALLIAGLPAVRSPAVAISSGSPRGVALTIPGPSSGFQATVTWNGADVSSASAMSAAISTSFGSTINLHYAWSYTTGGIGPKVNAYNISDARLQMFYFGFPLATRDVVDSNPQLANNGSFDMSWDPGVLQWVLAGIYGVTTSLLAPNGSTMWSDAFFVHVTAPGGVGAILPIILLLIGAYELFELARSGRQSASPPKQPTAPASASGDASAPASTPSDAAAGDDPTAPKGRE